MEGLFMVEGDKMAREALEQELSASGDGAVRAAQPA